MILHTQVLFYKTDKLPFPEDSELYFHIYRDYDNRYSPCQNRLQNNKREDSVLEN